MNGGEAAFKLVRAARLIDGISDGPTVGGAVLLQGGEIVAVGPQAGEAAPEGARVEVFDYPDATVMPGMVDCHTHHNGFGDGRLGDDLALLPDEVLTLQSARNARVSLFSGVTSIRENGPKNVTMFRLRDAIEAGRETGPRMVLCGRPVSTIGGHMGYMGSEVTGPQPARAMVRQLVKEGADYIKITATGGSTRTSYPLLPSFNVDELEAITGEAHKFGKLTAAHCSSTQGTVNCLDAGVDMIIHCVFREPDGSYNFREDVAERIGEQGAYVNPTIHVFRSIVWEHLQRRELRKLTPQEQADLDLRRTELDHALENCRRLLEMGVKVITGSDSSWGNYQLGNTVYETECLVASGMSAMDGVKSVTSEAARSLGIDGVTGTLEPGKAADVIVVGGNPAEDVRALWDVKEVFAAGRRIDRGSQDSLASTVQPRMEDA